MASMTLNLLFFLADLAPGHIRSNLLFLARQANIVDPILTLLRLMLAAGSSN